MMRHLSRIEAGQVMEKWIKVEAIAAVTACVYPIAKDSYLHFSSPGSQPGGGLMNWIPLFLCAVILLSSLAMYKDNWPFNRKKKIPELPKQPSQTSETLTLTPPTQTGIQQLTAKTVTQIELAGVLRSKAGQAEWLAKELEKVWHAYNNDGFRLIRPLEEHELPEIIQFNRHKRLWEFRIHYFGHIGEVEYHIKHHALDFHSSVIDGPRSYRKIEYLDLLQIIKDHAQELRNFAQSLESS
jgi:hypothetical protein